MKKTTSSMLWASFESCIGRICAARSASGITRVELNSSDKGFSTMRKDPSAFSDLFKMLRRYFSGKREAFDLPLDLKGTEFQMKIWGAMKRIPYGRVMSYAELAKHAGYPGAARAAGGACGANPVPLLIPCHRVVKADGSIGGYTGGVGIKKRLLDIECARLNGCSRS